MHLRVFVLCAFAVLVTAGAAEAQCTDPCTPQQEYQPASAQYYFNANVPQDMRVAFDAAAQKWNAKMEARGKPFRMSPGCCFEVKIDPTIVDVGALWTSNTSIAFNYVYANGPNANYKEAIAFHEIAHQLMGWANLNCDYRASVMAPKNPQAYDNPTDVTIADRCGLNRDMGSASPGGGGGGGGGEDQEDKCTSCSPIIINLDGGEIMLSPPNVSFDILAEGRTRTVSWTQAQSQDGFLAFDRNDDGMISDGRELFGNATPMSSTIVGDAAPDGFAALSFFDLHENGGNGNGRLDSGDSIFDRVVIWIDGNHDGVSQIQELKPLKAVGLVWMDLSPKEAMRRDIYGNLFRLRAHSLVESGGRSSLRYAYDVFFVSK